MPLTSAGILLYKLDEKDEPEVFLVHPGGPYFVKKQEGWWGIPKGLPNKDEELIEAAKREFSEETGFMSAGEFLELGFVKQKGWKTVYAWAIEGDIPEGWQLKCNHFKVEWPPRSGNYKSFPEVDEGRFFSLPEARKFINEAQSAFIDRLLQHLRTNS